MGQLSHRLADRYVVSNFDKSSVNSSFLVSVEPDSQRLFNSNKTFLSSRKLTHLIENTRNAGTSPVAICLLLIVIIYVVILFNAFTRKRFARGSITAAEATDDVDIELYDRRSQLSQG